MNLMNIFMVPLIMACATGGTIALLSIIYKYQHRKTTKRIKKRGRFK